MSCHIDISFKQTNKKPNKSYSNYILKDNILSGGGRHRGWQGGRRCHGGADLRCEASDWLAEQFRSFSESEKQWKARMEFILRHLPDYRDPPEGGGRLDQRLSLSMVWANHLFLGCSYNKDLLDKVMEMADRIEVEDLSQFTTRSELMKKHQS